MMGFRECLQLAQEYKGFLLPLMIFTLFPYLNQLHCLSHRHFLVRLLILMEVLSKFPEVCRNELPSHFVETSLLKFPTKVSCFNVTKFGCTHEVIYFNRDKSYHTFFQVLHITHKFQYQKSNLRIFHHQYLIWPFRIPFTCPFFSNFPKCISPNHLFVSS